VVLIILAVAYYGLSPLFIDIVFDEEFPGMENAESPTQTLATASIVDTPTHPAEGSAKIVRVADAHYLRYEDFKTLNGPDLYVYLAKDIEAKEFVDLGELRATEGNVNYEIPAGVNPEEYPYALIWCKQFGVLFNSAKLY